MLAGIRDFELMRGVIISKYARVKEKDDAVVKLNFLDFGAGDFSWSSNAVSCINEARENGGLPIDIEVSIF